MVTTIPRESARVVVPEQSLGPTADGVRLAPSPPQVGRHGCNPPSGLRYAPLVYLVSVNLDPDLQRLGLARRFLRPAHRDARSLPTLAEAYGDTESSPQGFAIRSLSVSVRSRGMLDAPETRIAVSVAQQGLAARLWSVALGVAALYGRFPTSTPGCCTGTRTAARPTTCGWPRRAPCPPTRRTSAGRTGRPSRTAGGGPAGPAARLRGPVAGQRGLRARGRRTRTRPLGPQPTAARTWATGPARSPPSSSPTPTCGHRHPDTGTASAARSCCLYYRVPGGGLCGDCCFVRPPRRR